MSRLQRILPAILIAALTVGPVSAATAITATQTVAQASAPAAAAATFTGTVTDSQGAPISGAQIFMVGPTSYDAKSDAHGQFSLSNVKPGLYTVAVTKPGYDAITQDDFLVAPGQVARLDITMTQPSLQSLRQIGAVRVSAGRGGFNTSGLSVTTLDSAKIVARVQPDLKGLVAELPGVVSTQDSAGRTPNSSFMVRGSQLETKVNIDGHNVSSGVFGTYNTNYANSEIFEQVEVLKGAGLNGPNAGESAIGTINLRTRNFSPRNEWAAAISSDMYGAGYYQFHINQNFLNDKLSVLVARSFQGYQGPDQNITGYNISGVGASGNTGYVGPALVQWQNELSNPYATLADLVKARYKFSQATSLTGEFLNLTGRYFNQGGSYAINYGTFPVAQCFNPAAGGKFVGAGGAGCTATSTYNPPFLAGLIGTNQRMYSYFPKSYVLNQEPQFSAELRTTFRGDTILLRPYQAEIKRFIDGSLENTTPGYGFKGGTPNGWYKVTSTANCQVIFAAPTAAGAKGPCFSGADNFQTPYVGAAVAGTPTLFPTTATAPVCTVAAPCWTTPTDPQRNGVYGYNTPFSQPEIDRTHGVTFSYIHPNHDNLYSFNVDYNTDNTLKYSGDTSPLPAGCFPTVGTVPNAPTYTDVAGVAHPNPYYQPACNNGGLNFGATPGAAPGTPGSFGTTPRNSLQIPPTTNYRTDYSLTALLQVTKKLQLGIGNYLTVQRLDNQFTDPAAAAAAANLDFDPITHKPTGRFNGAEQSDATLIHNVVTHTHYDPHFQAQYRVNSDISLRANAGSSVTMPYAGVTSGFTSLGINGGPDGKSDTLSVKNPNLQPEVTVAYDLGFDARLKNGMLIQADAFNNTIHNVFVSYSQLVPNLPGRSPSQTIQTTTINGPLERNYGIELTVQKAPAVGVGFYATATAQRAYYDGFSLDFYKGLAAFVPPGKLPGFVGLVNGKQLDSTTSFTGQVPYFKGKAEINWMLPNQHAYVAFGEVFNGNNNPFGTGAFSTFYANGTLDLGHNLAFRVAGENIFNFSTGAYNGNTLYGTGFTPIGVRYNPILKTLEYGNAFGGPNNVVIVKPANVYFTLTKKI